MRSTIGQLAEGEKCRTLHTNLFLQHRLGQLCNEFGTMIYPKDYDEPIEIIDQWPHLTEGEWFKLATKLFRGNPPAIGTLLFETMSGFRFKVDVGYRRHYAGAIPFYFKTSDPRVERSKAEWTWSSGRVIKMMSDATYMYITHAIGEPLTLHLNMNYTQYVTMVSGQ